MPILAQYSLQEGISIPMELLIYFHDYMMMFMLTILSFVSYLFLYVSFSPYSDKYTMDSHVLETVWTVIPMVILLFMAFPSLYLLYLMEDVASPALTIKVIGHQWYWEYQYFNSWVNSTIDSYMLQGNSSELLPLNYHNLDVDNRLILPMLSNLLFLITSADVLHAWTVPSLGIKADSVPGRLNYLTSMSSVSGIFFGQCSEICGSNHSFMPIVVEFIPMESFISYLSSLQ